MVERSFCRSGLGFCCGGWRERISIRDEVRRPVASDRERLGGRVPDVERQQVDVTCDRALEVGRVPLTAVVQSARGAAEALVQSAPRPSSSRLRAVSRPRRPSGHVASEAHRPRDADRASRPAPDQWLRQAPRARRACRPVRRGAVSYRRTDAHALLVATVTASLHVRCSRARYSEPLDTGTPAVAVARRTQRRSCDSSTACRRRPVRPRTPRRATAYIGTRTVAAVRRTRRPSARTQRYRRARPNRPRRQARNRPDSCPPGG